MVIPFVVPEILGGVEPPPQMPLSCQKRQMPLTVKFKEGRTGQSSMMIPSNLVRYYSSSLTEENENKNGGC